MRMAAASLASDRQVLRALLLVSILSVVMSLAAPRKAVHADTVYVDARAGSGLTPGVSDGAFSNSAAACGSVQTRYATSSSAWTQVRPTLAVPGGYYDVQVCHSGNSYGNISADLLTSITLTDATAISGDIKELGYTAKWRGGAGGYQDCTYYSVGIIKLADGVTTPTVRFGYRSGAIGGSSRWNVYGWCFTQVVPRALTVSADPSQGGVVTGAGDYLPGATVTVTAVQNDGYLFEKWTDGNGAEVSTSPTYSFTMPDTACALNAVFRTTTQKVLTLVPVPPAAAGSLTGGGYHEPGSLIYPTAAANPGYTFSKWSTNADGTDSVALPYVMPGVNSTLYAIFTQNHYTLTRTACDGGTVSGSDGSFTMGTLVTVTATPDPGYSFIGWTTDGCDGVSFQHGASTYTFQMPADDVSLTALFGKARFIESFESYETGGTSFESLDKNDLVGPNQSANGSGNPWWGPNAPNGRIHSSNPHLGSQCLRGTAGNCRDFYNLQHRLNSGSPFSGGVYLDWWFYDPLGPGGTIDDFCGDYTALSYYAGIPATADYATPLPYPMTGLVQQLAIGMSDDLSSGWNAANYQVRIQGSQGGYHDGWSNTNVTRSVGWHHARIVVGPVKSATGTNDVSFYIDDMSAPTVGPLDSVTSSGYNTIEINTIMPAGSCASVDGCRYSRYLHFSSVDDVSFGDVPNAPGPAVAGPVAVDTIAWNWLDSPGAEDHFNIWSSATGGILLAAALPGATSAIETGLLANTQYSRWVEASASQYCGEVTSARTALPPAYTLALPPVYGASGPATVTCGHGQSGPIQIGSPITFTAVNGFGVGPSRASSYVYVWNQSAAEPANWDGASAWAGGALVINPAAPGGYYLHIQACNGDGVRNPTTLDLGPYTTHTLDRICEAWAYGDNIPITLANKPVIASFANDSLWIEEQDRTAGMRVLYGATSADWLNHSVTVTGVLDSSLKPRTLIASMVDDTGPLPKIITPLGMMLSSVGGRDFNPQTPGISGGIGRYNIGMLVRIVGRVSFADNTTDPSNKYFYLDDGSAVSSNGHAGIKVKCGVYNAPSSGMVGVTGVVSVEQSGGTCVPVIIIRDINEVTPM